MDCITSRQGMPHFERLKTFSLSPFPNEKELSVSNSPIKFAEAGFVRSPSAKFDEVECSSCGIKYRGWSGESPLAVHRTLNPNCQFINTPQKSTSSLSSLGAHTNNTSRIRRQLFRDTSTFNAANFEVPFLPKVGGNMLFESHRLMTFDNVFSIESAMYAKAGFVLNKNIGKVVCVFCNVQIDHNVSSQLLELEAKHEDMSPQCPFVLKYDVGNISRDDEEKIRRKALEQSLSDACGGKLHKCSYIKHPEYEEDTSRLETFVTWPKLQASLFPAQRMVEAGFYYSGFMDKVKCYACGVSLYNWSPPAEPARQHARASPFCHFLAVTWGEEFIQAAQGEELTVDVEPEEGTEQATASSHTDCPTTSSSSYSSTPTAAATSAATSFPAAAAAASPGSPILDLEAVKAALACQYTIEQIAHAVRKFFVLSCGRYPNNGLLLGTLKAADENHIRLCEKSQELQESRSVIQATKSELQAKDSVIQAKDSQLQAKDSEIQATRSELQRTTFELQWRDLEVRTELEQQFVGQIQQAREMLEEKDQALEEKDQALEQHREVIDQKDQVIEHNAVQLEMKDKEVEDLQRHIRSLMAELDRRKQGLPMSDDEDGSSAASSDTEHHRPSSVSRISSSPSDSDSEASTPDEFPVASCKVCLVKPSQIVFLPCKHLCCCERCAAKLHGKNCPICRGQNLGYERVYVI